MSRSPGFTILDLDESGVANPQSVWMQSDIDDIMNGVYTTHVLNGCAVTAQGSPNMTVAVAAGMIASGGVKLSVAAGNSTIGTSDATNPRVDVVVADSTGAKQVRAGTAAANPKVPEVTAGDVVLAFVLVRASTTSILTADITDKRMFNLASYKRQFYNYDPDIPPDSPSATDDEFEATSLNGAWTSESPATLDVATNGFVHIEDSTGVIIGIWKAFVPGAAAFTVACKVSLDVSRVGSAQVLLGVSTSGAVNIAQVGALNGNLWIYRQAASFATGATGGGDLATRYFSIQRDTTTNYKLFVSNDGINWRPVVTFSQAGTVARVYLQVYGPGAITAAYFDFVRMFTSQTNKIGK